MVSVARSDMPLIRPKLAQQAPIGIRSCFGLAPSPIVSLTKLVRQYG